LAEFPRFRLLLPRRLYDEMVAHAAADLPNECCGLLAGVLHPANGVPLGRVTHRYPLVNVAASPREFLSDADSMFKAVKDMRRHDTDVLAVYHSHPTSQPVPSRTDLERNYSPGVVNLIVSLQEGGPSVRGWWLTSRDYAEAEWSCSD
jgi:proteasome lid subunit RPN8/RPN11